MTVSYNSPNYKQQAASHTALEYTARVGWVTRQAERSNYSCVIESIQAAGGNADPGGGLTGRRWSTHKHGYRSCWGRSVSPSILFAFIHPKNIDLWISMINFCHPPPQCPGLNATGLKQKNTKQMEILSPPIQQP